MIRNPNNQCMVCDFTYGTHYHLSLCTKDATRFDCDNCGSRVVLRDDVAVIVMPKLALMTAENDKYEVKDGEKYPDPGKALQVLFSEYDEDESEENAD